MATIVKLSDKKYSVSQGIIRVSEREIPFDTVYEVISSKTDVQKRFRFERSTGPEFDPKTEWVYRSEDGFEFRVCNDAEMAKRAEQVYLHKKLMR
jgi:hypothetical protein